MKNGSQYLAVEVIHRDRSNHHELNKVRNSLPAGAPSCEHHRERLRPRSKRARPSAQPVLPLPDTASMHAMALDLPTSSNCLLQRRETRTTSKEKNATDYIKKLCKKTLHHLMHINNITRLYAN
jgi:hypothetical protein